MEEQFLEMIDENSTGALHHALRLARCARGEHNVMRMIERQLFKLNFEICFFGEKIVIIDRIGDLRNIGLLACVGNHDDLFQRRDTTCDFSSMLQRVE